MERERRAVDGVGAQAREDRGIQPPAARRDRHQLRPARRRHVRFCRSVRYCITLDSDTRLPRDAARQLIGIITHPLNRPTFDPRSGRVTEGYGILQPRVSVTFTSAAGSLFARLYSGHTGVDPYTTAVSDTYQDLFGEGIFTGKGLYDVDAFMAALEDCVPENALLSHDLFEGLHARVALVSDVEIVDEYPSSVLTHARRQHRWIRGDWQILFWLFPFVPSRHGLKRNPLPLIGRWKILDNLRRSLVTPTLLAHARRRLDRAARAALVLDDGGARRARLAVAAASRAVCSPGPQKAQSFPVFWRNLREDAATALAQVVLSLTFLAYHAWETAARDWADAGSPGGDEAPAARVGDGRGRRRAGSGPRGPERPVSDSSVEMVASPSSPPSSRWSLRPRRPTRCRRRRPFLLAWTARAGHRVLAQPAGRPARAAAHRGRADAAAADRPQDVAVLRNVRDGGRRVAAARQLPGRRTTSRSSPGGHRRPTSAWGCCRRWPPTTSATSPTGTLVRRLDLTLTTLEGLERYQGPLPQLVRHVDAGAAASPICLDRRQRQPGRGAAHAGAGAPRLAVEPQKPSATAGRGAHRHRRSPGIASVSSTAGDMRSPRPAADRMSDWRARSSRAPAARSSTGVDPARLAAAGAVSSPRRASGHRLEQRERQAASRRAPSGPRAVVDAVDDRRDQRRTTPRRTSLHALARRASALADAHAVRLPLRSPPPHFLRLGIASPTRTVPARLDGSFYDLLASEARLASFVAIAKGDVPQHHWFHLGRLVTNVDGRATLMSWGGTMFEYLMPLLLMRSYPGTLLDQSCRACVRRQIEYGDEHGIPWGISESAYAVTDRGGTYQYKAFGVPGLGLKRGLSDELVVAPYATALASLDRSRRRGGEFPAAGPPGARRALRLLRSHRLQAATGSRRRHRGVAGDRRIRSSCGAYFAHHQGMSLVALANVVCDDVFVDTVSRRSPRRRRPSCCSRSACPARRFSSEPRPSEGARPSRRGFRRRQRGDSDRRTPRARTRTSCRTAATPPALTHAGGGASTWRGLAVTRQREDRTSDAGATLHLPARPVVGRRLVAHLPAGLPRARRIRGDLRARQGHVPAARRRFRDAAPGGRVAGGRRRGAAALDYQSRRSAARNRGDELRRNRAGASRGRPRPPRVREAVHRDGVRRAERRAAVQPAPARRRRGAGLGVPRARRRRTARRRRRVGNRPRAVPRPRAFARQSRRARRPRAVGHHRRRARSGRGAARTAAADAGRVRAGDLRHRRRAGPADGARARRGSIATPAPRRARSRWRSPTCTPRCSTWG